MCSITPVPFSNDSSSSRERILHADSLSRENLSGEIIIVKSVSSRKIILPLACDESSRNLGCPRNYLFLTGGEKKRKEKDEKQNLSPLLILESDPPFLRFSCFIEI